MLVAAVRIDVVRIDVVYVNVLGIVLFSLRWVGVYD